MALQQKCEEMGSTFITKSKADQLYRDFNNLTEEKTEVELELLKAREKWHEEQDRAQQLRVEKETCEKLFNELRRSSSSDITNALVAMSKDFQQMKLKEYKLQREHDDMKEKADYYTRLLKQRNDQIYVLEETAANSEAQMVKEREEFRKRDIERKA